MLKDEDEENVQGRNRRLMVRPPIGEKRERTRMTSRVVYRVFSSILTVPSPDMKLEHKVDTPGTSKGTNLR
jgi:hypothetical protein